MSDELIEPWLAGQFLAVRRGMTGATGNLYAGLHEFVDMILLLHFLRDDDLFFDIGGNVGTYTILASGICRAKTWVFEPDPVTAESLKRNIEINRLSDLVTIQQFALGESEGQVSFTVGLDTVNHVATSSDQNTRTVACRTLDSVSGTETPTMMKLDVEGYEEEVIRGALALLKRPRLKLIEIETVTPWIDAQLQEAGFVRAYYDPVSRRLSEQPTDIRSANVIYVRDWESVQARLISARPVEVLGQRI